MNIKKYIAAALVCCSITATLTSCTADERQETATQNMLRFEISDGGITRSATNGLTMTTTFEQGDQAGLYAVKDGQVILNNIPLTFSINGFWEAETPITATDNYAGAQFYAYYPYNEEALFNPSSATPFAEMVAAARPASRQNFKADYEAADLMVTGAATVGQYNTVSLQLHHQKALVTVELPNFSYIFENADIEPYVLSKSENVSFTLNGNTVQPYFDGDSQSYRLIVQPGEEGTLDVTFTTAGEESSFYIDGLGDLQAGQFAKYVVDGGAQLITTTLQPGDYYCADGHIVSKDLPVSELPENIIGVVFKLGTTEAIRTTNSNWSHGIVLCIAESDKKTPWATSRANDIPSSSRWFDEIGLAPQYGTNANNFDEELMSEEGYELTQAWKKVPESLAIAGLTEPLDLVSTMKNMLDTFEAGYPTPAVISTGWYVPSMKDWVNIEKQYTLIAGQLENIGGMPLRWDGDVSNSRYWTPNMRDRRSMWAFVGNKTTLSDRYKGPVLSDSSPYYRFIMAF